MPTPIIQTSRLIIRKAEPSEVDVEFYYKLWTNGDVMKNVGYPTGLRTSREKILDQIERNAPKNEYDALLLAVTRDSGEIVGECKLGKPNDEGTCYTDVKLLPDHWGNRYGVEIKQALVDYLFTNTECKEVEATPNVANIASQKMQEAVGAKRVGEEVYKFPPEMADYTCDVHHFTYILNRETWEAVRQK